MKTKKLTLIRIVGASLIGSALLADWSYLTFSYIDNKIDTKTNSINKKQNAYGLPYDLFNHNLKNEESHK